MPLEVYLRYLRSERTFLFQALLLAAVVLPCPNLFAASIAGRVSDTEGTPIAGAQVIAQGPESPEAATVVTQPDGTFTFDSLPAGSYTVTVRRPGFAELVQPNVAVASTGESVRFNFRLRSNREQSVGLGIDELNPNVFVVKLDTNEIVRQMGTRGANTQLVTEFRSQENSFGAPFGYPMRQVDLARPGTFVRSFHGTLSEAHQNSSMNARSFFTVGGLLPSRRNEYGATAGGPLVRDKLMTDVAWSQTRDSGYVNGNIQVPLPEERFPRSDDPATNAVVARLLLAYPSEQPNLPGVSPRQLNTNAPRDIASTAFSTRLEYRPRETDQVVFEQRFFDSTEQPFELVIGQNPVTYLRPQSYHLTHNHVFSPSTVSRVAFNFDRLAVFLDVTDSYKNLLAPLGITNTPDISLGRSGDLTTLGPGPNYPRLRVENRFHIAPEIRHNRGNHAFSVGVLASRLQTNDLQSDNSRGVYEFTRNFGHSTVENFLLGQPSSFKINLGDFYRGFRNWEYAAYFHDRMRVRPNLTLSLGLRYELMTAPVEVNGLTQIPYQTDANNFAPQFGFAWNPRGGKTAIRGGYGVSFSTIFPLLYQRARFNPPAVEVISIDNKPSLTNPLQDLDQAGGEDARSGLNLLSPDLVSPYMHLYTLSIERELPTGLQFRMGYMGSRMFKLPWEVITNRAVPTPGIPTTTATINQRRPDRRYLEIDTISNGTIAYYDSFNLSVEKRLSRSMTWSVRYIFSKVLDTGDTTFYDIGTGRHKSMVPYDIIGDLKGPSQFDTPHALTIQYRYQVPSFAGSNLLTRALGGWRFYGNYSLRSGTPYMLHTGSDAPGLGNVDGVGQDRPHILNTSILGKSIDNPDTSTSILRPEYFDPNIPFGGRGNLGFDTFRLDGTNNMNFAVERDFALRRGADQTPLLQFRGEFFNFLNHPQFDAFSPHIANEVFGKITNTINRGRITQVQLRLRF